VLGSASIAWVGTLLAIHATSIGVGGSVAESDAQVKDGAERAMSVQSSWPMR
jgi:hypothetical protein